MKKLTKLNGIGEYELQACFDCGDGCGPDNENCGNCQKSLDACQRLGEYESTDLTPEEIGEQKDYVAGLEAIIGKFRDQMKQISNIAVGWQEDGPCDDADAEAFQAMGKIARLSDLPPKEVRATI